MTVQPPPLRGPEDPVSTLQGQWYVVIHTYGRKEFSAHERVQFDDVPGRRPVRPTTLSERDSKQKGQRLKGVPLDLDASLHVGHNSAFTLWDPERETGRGVTGIRSSRLEGPRRLLRSVAVRPSP